MLCLKLVLTLSKSKAQNISTSKHKCKPGLKQINNMLCWLAAVDHPFVASLYGTIQTGTHLHFLMEYCEGGELYGLLTTQPTKRLKESHMRFYVAEVGNS